MIFDYYNPHHFTAKVVGKQDLWIYQENINQPIINRLLEYIHRQLLRSQPTN